MISVRNQLLETYGGSISLLLNPMDYCEEALAQAYDKNVADHMMIKFKANCQHWVEKSSALWMLNMDHEGRRRVGEFFSEHGVDSRVLDLVMKMYNQLSEEKCLDLCAPSAWNVFNAYNRDALAMLSYVYINDNHDSEECAKVLFSYL